MYSFFTDCVIKPFFSNKEKTPISLYALLPATQANTSECFGDGVMILEVCKHLEALLRIFCARTDPPQYPFNVGMFVTAKYKYTGVKCIDKTSIASV